MFKMKSLVTDNDIQIDNICTRPIKNSNGIALNDEQLINMAIKKIEQFETTTNKPSGINKNFFTWLKEAKEYCDNGGNICDFKQKTINKVNM